MKSSEFSFHFMPGLIIMCASRLSLQTFLLYIFPLLFSSNPTTFFRNEHYQLSLLKQGYWNHHLYSVLENKTKFPALKHNWMLLLHQVTPSRSIRKQAPHRAVTTLIPAPVQLCSASGTSTAGRKIQQGAGVWKEVQQQGHVCIYPSGNTRLNKGLATRA